MSSTEKPDQVYLKTKNADNKLCLVKYNGVPVVNPECKGVVVDGCSVVNRTITPVAEFGDSGEVFDHVAWRTVFDALYWMPESRHYLVSLCGNMLIRGKAERRDYKGRCCRFNVPLPQLGSPTRAKFEHLLGTKDTYPLYINFATSDSRVSSVALTPERFKCLVRSNMTINFVKTGKMPSTCESNGYADLFRSLLAYDNRPPATGSAAEREEIRKQWKPEVLYWNEIMSAITDDAVRSNITSLAAAAGSLSSKEVYQVDEDIVKGTIWWSGINAMMADASNLIKSRSKTEQERAKLEATSFYSDFKRKMIARRIKVIEGPSYESFLSIMAKPMIKYLKHGTLMTSHENTLLEQIIREATSPSPLMPSGSESAVYKRPPLQGKTYEALTKNFEDTIKEMQKTLTLEECGGDEDISFAKSGRRMPTE